jgi:hypothetical protein
MIFTAAWKVQAAGVRAEGKRNLQLFENEVSGRYLNAVNEQFRQGCAAGAAPGPLTSSTPLGLGHHITRTGGVVRKV